MANRKSISAVIALLAITVASALLTASPARALIVVPSWSISPNPGELGTTFTFAVHWPSGSDAPDNIGCPNDMPWRIVDEAGNDVVTGTIPANVYDPVTNTVQASPLGTATIGAPNRPGNYTLLADAKCDGVALFGRDFDVTGPTSPPPTLFVSPSAQTRTAGTTAKVIAKLTDGTSGVPIIGSPVSFTLTGPNSESAGTCVPADCKTAADGTVTWAYQGTNVGNDTVNVSDESGASGGQAAVTWTRSLLGSAYAALGDSYSAGEGLGAYLAGTDTPNNRCHRSPIAYAPLLAAQAGQPDLAFVACSGAVTNDLFSLNHSGNRISATRPEPAQFCQTQATSAAGITIPACGPGRLPALGTPTKSVTLTIGGNDAGFSGVLQSCLYGNYGPFNLGRPGRGCSASANVVVPTLTRLAALAGLRQSTIANSPIRSLSAVLAAIHKLAPNAQVYIAGYPRLFQITNGRDCVVGTAIINGGAGFDVKVAVADARWLDQLADVLNSTIRQAAQRAGSWATYVDVSDTFAGHGLCSPEPWLLPVNANVALSARGYQLTTPAGDAHPDVAGQRYGYADAVSTAMQ